MMITDQMKREVEIPGEGPERIVSLVPSQTELLYHLGLGDKVVGITDFCVRPRSWFEEKPHVGGTKLVLQKKVDALNPDLIIGNKEENTPRDIHRLEKKYPVWMSDITTLQDALDMIRQIGLITDKEQKAKDLLNQIQENFEKLKPVQSNKRPIRIAYFIWKNPWMVAGNHTFIHHFAEKMGFENVFGDLDRYPEIDLNEVNRRQLDFVLLSSEPFSFSEKNVEDFEDIISQNRVRIVDGQMFSWYGSRLVEGIQYLGQLRQELNENLHL